MKTFNGSSATVDEPFSIFQRGMIMKQETLYQCVDAFNRLAGTSYIIHLGRAGKRLAFEIQIDKEDCHHLMGLHYLKDRPDARNRRRIFEDILCSREYREHLASSELWTPELENRVACTTLLERILDDNGTIIRYNPKRHRFYTMIRAEYLFAHKNYPVAEGVLRDVYLFVDKRDYSDFRYCKSIFPKKDYDYMEFQAIWQLLYKEKHATDGSSEVLFRYKKYDPSGAVLDER